MRIISQDKKWDTPYEKVTIRVHADTSLILASEVGGNSEFPIGSYKTHERALEVMKEIRLSYVSFLEYKSIPTVIYEMPQE